MGPWSVLGIDKTSDTREIKKAYVKLLKVYHPEDDPEGFMKLKAAYDLAMKNAKRSANTPESTIKWKNPIESMSLDIETINEQVNIRIETNEERNQERNEERNIQENAFKKLLDQYKDFFKRIDVKRWETFFFNLTVDEHQIIFNSAPNFFNVNCHLPLEVWKCIDRELFLSTNNNFKWSKLIEYDYNLYYNIFDREIACDYGKYVALRFQAFEAFWENDYKKSQQRSKIAIEIFAKDSGLYKILALSQYMLGEYENALENFSHLLALDSCDIDSLLYRGRIILEKKDYSSALSDFEQVIKISPNNNDAKKGIVHALICLSDYNKAEEMVDKELGAHSNDMEWSIFKAIIQQIKASTTPPSYGLLDMARLLIKNVLEQ